MFNKFYQMRCTLSYYLTKMSADVFTVNMLIKQGCHINMKKYVIYWLHAIILLNNVLHWYLSYEYFFSLLTCNHLFMNLKNINSLIFFSIDW